MICIAQTISQLAAGSGQRAVKCTSRRAEHFTAACRLPAASPPRGFTLLELVLVMLIICIAMAMAAPALSSWRNGADLKNAGDQVLSLIRYARSQAIIDCTTYRISFDSQANTYQLSKQDGTDFSTVATSRGLAEKFPDGVKFQLTKDATSSAVGVNNSAAPMAANSTIATLDFFPTGRCETGSLQLTDAKNFNYTLRATTPSQGWHQMTDSK